MDKPVANKTLAVSFSLTRGFPEAEWVGSFQSVAGRFSSRLSCGDPSDRWHSYLASWFSKHSHLSSLEQCVQGGGSEPGLWNLTGWVQPSSPTSWPRHQDPCAQPWLPERSWKQSQVAPFEAQGQGSWFFWLRTPLFLLLPCPHPSCGH